jgi:thiol-disulfide isomerase/thioredoxin
MSRKESKQLSRAARRQQESALKENSKGSSRSSQGSSRQRRRHPQRRSPLWFIGGLLACVVIIVGIFIYLADHQTTAGVIGPTDPKVLSEVTHVKQSVISQVNTGGVQNTLLKTNASQQLTGQNAKPEIFYYGAEFCPYCAAQRWSLVVALSRFGTFSKLPESLSSDQDVDPNTPTFTFVNSQYTSPYLDFVPVEAQDRDHKTLQTPAPQEQAILKQYSVNGFPFLNIANQYVASAPFYDPALLLGLSQEDIASRLSNPNDNLTKNIVGGANYLTAAICSVVHDQPASVCAQSPIPAIKQTVLHSPLWKGAQADVPINRRSEGEPAA